MERISTIIGISILFAMGMGVMLVYAWVIVTETPSLLFALLFLTMPIGLMIMLTALFIECIDTLKRVLK